MKHPAPNNAPPSAAVLDALPEAIFLLDSIAGTLQPLNRAAADWTLVAEALSGPIGVSQIFPELNLASLSEYAARDVLVQACEPGAGRLREVAIRLHPLHPPTAHGVDGTSQWILVARPIQSPGLNSTELAAHDALDDAFHDLLTRLPNRRLFERRLQRAIERAVRSTYCFALLFVDLDRFKQINDRFGHQVGDQLLVVAARRMIEAVRPQDMVARRDGDEFTILLDDLAESDDAVGVAQRIIEHLQRPWRHVAAALRSEIRRGEDANCHVDASLRDANESRRDSATYELNIGASIGVVVSDDGRTAHELIALADHAMYQAKSSGGGIFIAPHPSQC